MITSGMLSDPNSLPPLSERLESWKEIAAYLKKGVRTVQRWERTDGLPVRRLGQERTGVVFAYKAELDAWWLEQSRRIVPAPEPATSMRHVDARPRRHTVAIFCDVDRWLWRLSFGPRSPGSPGPAPICLPSHPGHERPRLGVTALLFAGRPSDRLRVDAARRARVHPYKKHRPRIQCSPYVKCASGTQSRMVAGRTPRRLFALSKSAERARNDARARCRRTGGEIAEVTIPGGLSWSADGQWLLATDGLPKAQSIVAISVKRKR